MARLRLATILFGRPDFAEELGFWHPYFRSHAARSVEPSQSRRVFPAALMAHAHAAARKPQVLEVGSGPFSLLGWGVEQNMIELIAVDILASEYRLLRAAYGVTHPVTPIKGSAERISSYFPGRRFDIAYSSNALDHTRCPRAVVEAISAVLADDGLLVLEGFYDEGSFGDWNGLHQHDLRFESETIMAIDQSGRRTDLLAGLGFTLVAGDSCLFEDRGLSSHGYELDADHAIGRHWYQAAFRKDLTG